MNNRRTLLKSYIWNYVVSNSGKATLENSIKGDIDLELLGNSAQLTTTGKNLFDIKKASDVSNYITTETLAKIDISAAIVFDVKKNTNYCLSVSGKTDQPSINFNIANDVQRKSIFNKLKTEETLNSLDSGKIYVGFSGGDTELNATKLSQEYFDIQLEEASSKTPYEPYTGLKPSPSPEYQQEIKFAGKWNEEKQKHEIDVKVMGKNLFNLTDNYIWGWFAGYQTQISLHSVNAVVYMPCKPNTTYTIYGRTNINGNNNVKNRVATANDFPAGGTKLHNITETQLSNPVTITTDELSKYLVIMAVTDNECDMSTREQVLKKNVSKMMVIIGNAPTPYEPYQEQTLTLTSDRPLTKWDKLTEQDGEYGWLYQSEVKEYRGEKSVSLYDSGFYFLLNNKNITKGEGYCSELKQHVPYEKNPCINFNIAQNTYVYTLNTQEIYGSTVSEIKEYLKIHPLHLVYKTETSDFIPLSQQEQTQLRNLHSENGVTHVFVDSGEVECGIKVAYKQKKV